MSVIIGINCGLHDASACLVVDGTIASAMAEERFTRIKHDGTYPHQAIRHCLDSAGLKYSDVDGVAYSWNYMAYELDKLIFHIDKTLNLATTRSARAGIAYLKAVQTRKQRYYSIFAEPQQISEQYFKCEFSMINHHTAHAYSVFPLSGFSSSAVLIVDGAGEKETISIWRHENQSLTHCKSYSIPNSLGLFYGAITQYLGFSEHDEEWKVMGWAPYGEPRFYDQLKQVIKTQYLEISEKYFQGQDGLFPWYTKEMVSLLGVPPRGHDAEFDVVYADIAASAQLVLEEAFLQLAQEARDLTGETRLCMAGGVALNGKATGVIASKAIFDEIFVQPASADDGTAIGAALWLASKRGEVIVQDFPTLYQGPQYSADDISAAIARFGSGWRILELADNAIDEYIADQLVNERIVGWFQGSSEFGPRALGNRSILATPCSPAIKDTLNEKIKFRESFRPFAPSVLAEYASEYFSGLLDNAYYMNRIVQVRPEMQGLIPAVTHVDGTARVQLVTDSHNERFYRLLKKFHARSGVPVLLNTSFNVKGEPIVETPDDALRCFRKTGIDVLVMGKFVIEKV